jgi:uncharacterized membrane protein YgdD (TMEM256/DUF423 family)
MSSVFLTVGALSGGLAVALGAFGAHGLQTRLAAEKLATYETAVRYHFYHALALVAVGLAQGIWPGAGLLSSAGWLFVAGTVLFSGSLYLLAISGVRWLGAIAPLGGLAFIAGWVLMAFGIG